MKNSLLLFVLTGLFFMLRTEATAQTFACTIQNQTVTGNQFKFDIYVQTTSGTFYIGNCDFVVTFNNANFTSPSVTRSINPIFLAGAGDGYIYSMAVSIVSGNRIILNVGAPIWDSQSFFDSYVVQPSGTAPGTRVATITITGISNPSGAANIQWRTTVPNNTGVSNIASSSPWAMTNMTANGTFIDPANASLPVELVSFTAAGSESGVDLAWQTATEANNHGFEVERKRMADDRSPIAGWTKIGFVAGQGTSNTPHQYSYSDATCSPGTYAYRLKQIDNDGLYKYSSETIGTMSVPKVFTLNQNYPNPFNPSTTLSFSLAQDGVTTLKIYNILGKEVATLVSGEMKAGVLHTVVFDASALSSGVYFSRLESGGKAQSKRLVLMK